MISRTATTYSNAPTPLTLENYAKMNIRNKDLFPRGLSSVTLTFFKSIEKTQKTNIPLFLSYPLGERLAKLENLELQPKNTSKKSAVENCSDRILTTAFWISCLSFDCFDPVSDQTSKRPIKDPILQAKESIIQGIIEAIDFGKKENNNILFTLLQSESDDLDLCECPEEKIGDDWILANIDSNKELFESEMKRQQLTLVSEEVANVTNHCKMLYEEFNASSSMVR